MIVAAAWVLFSIVVAGMAWRRGRSAIWWLLLSLMLSPLLIVFVLLGLGDSNEKIDRQEFKTGNYQPCPYCEHAIRKQSAVCRHCARVLGEHQTV